MSTDSFTGTDGVALDTYSANWAKCVGLSGTDYLRILSNHATHNVGSVGQYQVYRWTPTPVSADYSATVTLVSNSNGILDGVGVRVIDSGAADATSYGYFLLARGAALPRIQKRTGAGLVTVIDIFTTTQLADATAYRVTLTVSGSSTTTLEGKIQRVSDGYWLTSAEAWDPAEQVCLSGTDSSSPYTAAGSPTIELYAAGNSTISAHYLDDFATDADESAASVGSGLGGGRLTGGILFNGLKG